MFSSWIRYNEDIKVNKYITVPVDLKNIYFYKKRCKVLPLAWIWGMHEIKIKNQASIG